jgi:hypothetical protein
MRYKQLGVADSQIHTSLLPRTFTVFFNTNKSTALSEQKVRQALSLAIDKDAIVKTVLHNYGKVLMVHIHLMKRTLHQPITQNRQRLFLKEVKGIQGKQVRISITLATANTDEMKESRKHDQNLLGSNRRPDDLEVYEVSDLNQSVIKDRDFEALLFGSITETPADLYAFWHSSQRTYPGLNISGYVSNSSTRISKRFETQATLMRDRSCIQSVKKEFKKKFQASSCLLRRLSM